MGVFEEKPRGWKSWNQEWALFISAWRLLEVQYPEGTHTLLPSHLTAWLLRNHLESHEDSSSCSCLSHRVTKRCALGERDRHSGNTADLLPLAFERLFLWIPKSCAQWLSHVWLCDPMDCHFLLLRVAGWWPTVWPLNRVMFAEILPPLTKWLSGISSCDCQQQYLTCDLAK